MKEKIKTVITGGGVKMLRRLFPVLVCGLTLVMASSYGFSEEMSKDDSTNQSTATKTDATAREWVMGIVKSVNLEGGTIDVSYYDFENDEDKVITISTNDKTEYIGMQLKDINPGDDIEVSYTYSNDGTPIAEAVITAKLQTQKEENAGNKAEK